MLLKFDVLISVSGIVEVFFLSAAPTNFQDLHMFGYNTFVYMCHVHDIYIYHYI